MPENTRDSLDALADAFEHACRAGQRPDVSDYLGRAVPGERAALLRELVRLELEYAIRAGVPFRVEEVLARHPELAADRSTVLDLISLEYRVRRACAQDVTLTEYADRFPTFRNELASALSAGGNPTEPAATRRTTPRVHPGRAGGPPPAVPGYEIERELGRGGMGVVYKARHLKLNRTVALKMIVTGGRADDEERARFAREAEAIARLRDPGVVQIYEIGEFEGRPFFALEFCPAGSLDRRLAAGPLQPREAASVVEEVASAVQAAHDAKVLHRDLKPANILLQVEGRKAGESDPTDYSTVSLFDLQPKVTDFGLAKRLDEDGHTQTGAVMGTPSYMAPEQADGRTRDIGPRSDIYALGAILYECLTGKPPFRAATAVETLVLARTREPVSPRRLRPELPRDLETICLKCLQKDPARRYATAREVADELERFLDGKPIVARPVSRAERVRMWVRREPVKAGAFSLFALALLTLAVVLVVANQKVSEANTGKDTAAKGEIQAIDDRKIAEDVARKAKVDQDAAEVAEKKARDDAARKKVWINLERGLSLCERGDTQAGLLWIVEALRVAPPDDRDLANVIRTNLACWARVNGGLAGQVAPPRGVWGVACAPDGRTAVVGAHNPGTGAPDTVLLWDTATGTAREIRLEANVTALAYSADGRRLALGDARGNVRVFDARTGEPVGKPVRHAGAVSALAFSADGAVIVTGSADKTAGAWTVATGERVGEVLVHIDPVSTVAITGDGKRVLTASKGATQLWDLDTGAFKKQLKQTGFYSGFELFPDRGSFFAPAAGKVQRVSLPALEPLGPPLAAASDLRALSFQPGGALAALARSEAPKPGDPPVYGAQFWNLATGGPVGRVLPHAGTIEATAFSADGGTLLTASRDKVRRWSVASGEPLGPVVSLEANLTPAHGAGLQREVALSADGRIVVSRDGSYFNPGRGARLFFAPGSLVDGPGLAQLPTPGGVYAMAVLPGGELVVFGGKARVFDAKTRATRGESAQTRGSMSPRAISPDGRRLVVAMGNRATVWDTATMKPFGPDRVHPQEAMGAAFTADGRLVTASGSPYGVSDVGLWRADGTPVGRRVPLSDRAFSSPGALALAPSDEAFAIAVSGVGVILGALGDDGVKLLKTLEMKERPIALQFTSDSRVLLVGTAKGIERRDAATGELLPAAPLSQAGSMGALGPDGKRVLTTGPNTARVWDVATGRPIGEPFEHPGAVTTACWSADGSRVLTGCRDNQFRLWDVATARRIGPPLPHRDSTAAAFHPDGKHFATGGGDGVTQFWEIPDPKAGTPEALRLWVEVLTSRELDPTGAVVVLDAKAWQERRAKLDLHGGLTPP